MPCFPSQSTDEEESIETQPSRRDIESGPERDHLRIVRLMACYEFPWDMTRALELALFRTYCVPSISGLLERTAEFARQPQKRYDAPT